MVRERFKEIVDFATTESPYQQATKGWINDDIYVQWGSWNNPLLKTRQEFAKISLLWNPINQIFLRLLLVFFLSTILVVTVVSFSHNKFNISRSSSQLIVEENVINEEVVSLSIDESAVLENESINRSEPSLDIADESLAIQIMDDNGFEKQNPRSAITAQDMFQPKRL